MCDSVCSSNHSLSRVLVIHIFPGSLFKEELSPLLRQSHLSFLEGQFRLRGVGRCFELEVRHVRHCWLRVSLPTSQPCSRDALFTQGLSWWWPLSHLAIVSSLSWDTAGNRSGGEITKGDLIRSPSLTCWEVRASYWGYFNFTVNTLPFWSLCEGPIHRACLTHHPKALFLLGISWGMYVVRMRWWVGVF